MKRVSDVAIAMTLLLVLLPVFVVLAACVAIFMGRPVLFVQQRPGQYAKPFRLLKFRTMSEVMDREGMALPDQQRLTGFGRFLRATSLDELPELWNVLRGDMNLVGPRPLLMEYLPLYTAEQARRHEVRPGITGWAQVNGRNALSWEDKFKLDVWYVDNRSFWLDIKILFTTIKKVITREGIAFDGHATMPVFRGRGHG